MLMFFQRDVFECISTYVHGLVKNLLLHITYIRYSSNFIVFVFFISLLHKYFKHLLYNIQYYTIYTSYITFKLFYIYVFCLQR